MEIEKIAGLTTKQSYNVATSNNGENAGRNRLLKAL